MTMPNETTKTLPGLNKRIIEALTALITTGEAELIGWTMHEIPEGMYAASKGNFGITSDNPHQMVKAIIWLDQSRTA